MTSTAERAIEINYKLYRKNSSQAAVARIHKVTPTAVWNVVWRRSESHAIKKTISKIVGEPIESLWPKEDRKERAA